MEKVWYFADGGGPIGPFSLEQLQAKLNEIPAGKDVLVWSPKFPEWRRVAEVRELKPLAAAMPPMPPPLPTSFPSSASGSPEQTTGKAVNNAVTGVLATLFISYLVISNITPNTQNAIRLVLENLTFWLLMMVAGIIAFRFRSNWRFLFSAALALLPLLALPGTFHTDERQGYIHAGFALVGVVLGAFIGQIIKHST